jgi:P-type E1-E2 ATPase
MYNNYMIEINVPGNGSLQLEHLVCDVSGTLAVDGQLIEGVARSLKLLKDRLIIHLVTADTHGKQFWIDQQLGLKAVRIKSEGDQGEADQKAEYVQRLGAEKVAAIGQGRNDALMLKTAALGICVSSVEGTAVETLLSADIVVPGILSALELFEKPLRLVATLRK